MLLRTFTRSISVCLLLATAAQGGTAVARELSVCADPNNLPFSNDRREGFENRIVKLLAQDLGASVRYTWWAQRRGYVRNTLSAGQCDVIPGIAKTAGVVATTDAYYRSSYVFVTRADRRLDLSSFDDPRLHKLLIGVQMIGDDFSNTPPAHALSDRGIVGNVRGFMVYGDYAETSRPPSIIDAVTNKTIDVALVWGPLAGYYASRSGAPIRLAPVPPFGAGPVLPMVYDIAMGVRKGDGALRDELNQALRRNQKQIHAILNQYGVPQVDADAGIAP